MGAFVAQVAGQAPLQIQLGAQVQSNGGETVNTTHPSMIVELEASSAGDSTSGFVGEASRPIFFRPDIPGYVTDAGLVRYGQPLAGHYLPNNTTSNAGWLSSFSFAPATPPIATSATNLPIRVRWLFPPRQGIVVSDFFVFYAGSANQHTWNGRLVWEER